MQPACLPRLAALILAIIPCAARAADGDILSREVVPGAPEAHAVVERIIYESDGLKILGYLAYPKDAPQAAPMLPSIVLNRGGNRDFGAWTPERFAASAEKLTGWGYVLFASNYRGSPGSEGRDEFGGKDVDDILNGIRVLDQIPFADPARIGMWGHSRGGMMTYLALTKTDRVRAAIVGAGLADLERAVTLRPEMDTGVAAECIPDWATNRAGAIESRSAVRWADRLPPSVPILLVHGTADWRVDPRDALDMAGLMLKHRKPCRLIMFEGADHGLTEFRAEYDAAVHQWLDAYVRDGKPLPNLEPHGR